MAPRQRESIRVTWWGHATTEICIDGRTVVTDPVLGSRIGHLVRRRGPTPSIRLRSPDVVVLSHLHADHTHLPSLALLAPNVPIVVPRGAPHRLSALGGLGNPLVEIDEGETVEVGGLRIAAVPADHDGRRWRRGHRTVNALGYLIDGRNDVRGQRSVYFAGDTALLDTMADWVPTCAVALLPVGGWGPTLGHGHMDAADAALQAGVVDARFSVPIHYGTFWPLGMARVRPHKFRDPGRDFVDECRAVGREAKLLEPGESWTVPGRSRQDL